MVKKSIAFCSIVFGVLLQPMIPVQARTVPTIRHLRQNSQDAYALVEMVNAFRVKNGKIPYEISPILMSTAQGQAEYMASIGQITHLGPGGVTTTNRLIAAGFPLAGDLSLGGIRSENTFGGTNMTIEDAFSYWQGDDIHLNTMTSPNYTQIGAGIAVSGEDVYFVIDCARHIGAKIPYLTNTPAPTIEGDNSGQSETSNNSEYVDLAGEEPLARSLSTATPDTGGNLYHMVKPGETLWLIAVSYGVKIVDIRQLNGLSETEAIFPKQKLLIRQAAMGTAGPTKVGSATPFVPTFTPRPTHTLQPTSTPTPTPEAGLFASNGQSLLPVVFVLSAGLVAILFVQFRKEKNPD